LTSEATNPGQYSPRNARYDWLTLNHFADLSESSAGITLSNADCYFMQRGNSTTTPTPFLDVTTPQLKVLVGGRDPNGTSVILNQGGDAHFLQRFALQTHGSYNQVAAMKFALEHQNPLVTGTVTGGADYPETTYSLLTISDPNVLLWALKPADDGFDSGVIARVWNLAAAPKNLALTIPSAPILSAMQVTHIETPLSSLPVASGVLNDTLATQQLKTYALSVTSAVIPTPTPTSTPTVTPTPTITPTPTPTPILDKKVDLPLVQNDWVPANQLAEQIASFLKRIFRIWPR